MFLWKNHVYLIVMDSHSFFKRLTSFFWLQYFNVPLAVSNHLLNFQRKILRFIDASIVDINNLFQFERKKSLPQSPLKINLTFSFRFWNKKCSKINDTMLPQLQHVQNTKQLVKKQHEFHVTSENWGSHRFSCLFFQTKFIFI